MLQMLFQMILGGLFGSVGPMGLVSIAAAIGLAVWAYRKARSMLVWAGLALVALVLLTSGIRPGETREPRPREDRHAALEEARRLAAEERARREAAEAELAARSRPVPAPAPVLSAAIELPPLPPEPVEPTPPSRPARPTPPRRAVVPQRGMLIGDHGAAVFAQLNQQADHRFAQEKDLFMEKSRTFEADLRQYQADLAQYSQDMDRYRREKAAYDAAVRRRRELERQAVAMAGAAPQARPDVAPSPSDPVAAPPASPRPAPDDRGNAGPPPGADPKGSPQAREEAAGDRAETLRRLREEKELAAAKSIGLPRPPAQMWPGEPWWKHAREYTAYQQALAGGTPDQIRAKYEASRPEVERGRADFIQAKKDAGIYQEYAHNRGPDLLDCKSGEMPVADAEAAKREMDRVRRIKQARTVLERKYPRPANVNRPGERFIVTLPSEARDQGPFAPRDGRYFVRWIPSKGYTYQPVPPETTASQAGIARGLNALTEHQAGLIGNDLSAPPRP